MFHKSVIFANVLLAATIASSASFADPPDNRGWKAKKEYQEHERERQKSYREVLRENTKLRMELAREDRKYREEREREERKHWKEKHKNYKKGHHHERDDYESNRGYYEAVSHQPSRPYWGGYDPRYSARYGADSYGISQGRCSYPQFGAPAGGVTPVNALGNAIGNTIGGENPLMGAIAGAVVNQMLGNRVGQSMDPGDRFCFSQALEYGYDQRPIAWANQATNSQYHFVPLRSYQASNGNWCREFNYQLSQNGQILDTANKTACRMANGNWQ